MRIALIGLGHIAEHQMRALQRIPQIELTDAHDTNPERAAGLASDVRFAVTFDDLLGRSAADVFIVATPTDAHFEVAQRLLAAGRAVLVEKPMCRSQQELEQLVALSRDAFLHVALHAAFGPELEWWIANAAARETGDLVRFDCGFFDPYVRDGELQASARSLVGSWVDSAINALSVIGRLIDPARLELETARMTSVPMPDCAQIQGSATFSFAAGRRTGHGTIDTNWTLGLDQKTTRLWFENAEVLLHHSERTIWKHTGGEWSMLADLRNSYPALEEHYHGLFIDLLEAHRTGRTNLNHAETLHRLMIAAQSSPPLMQAEMAKRRGPAGD